MAKPSMSQYQNLRGMAAAIVIVIVIFAALIYYSEQSYGPKSGYFVFNGTRYNFTQIDVTPQQLRQGLMNDTNITDSTFALLIFPSSGYWDEWMKNTYSPTDVMWVRNSTVVYMITTATCVSYDPDQTSCVVYAPNSTANYMIETKAGFFNRTGVRVGDTIKIYLNK
ncbi:MAG: DUF192 domain-containing protein [Candidatus Micrarchaeota archaeon]|nr:DUF192 domain-containing protein [Candidatus Micrarchaeota archaeon]